MSLHPTESFLQKNLRIVEAHLERNRNWVQWPENVIHSFEKNTNQSDAFIKEMQEIEIILKDIERMFDEE